MTEEDGSASGFVCPACGGALWDKTTDGAVRFECRIGHAFSALELWIQHCAARNTALMRAQRALAENAALARKLADWARGRGDTAAAVRLEQESVDDQGFAEQVGRMLEDLPPPEGRTGNGPEAQ